MVDSDHPWTQHPCEKGLHSPIPLNQKQIGTHNELDSRVNLSWMEIPKLCCSQKHWSLCLQFVFLDAALCVHGNFSKGEHSPMSTHTRAEWIWDPFCALNNRKGSSCCLGRTVASLDFICYLCFPWFLVDGGESDSLSLTGPKCLMDRLLPSRTR